MPPGSEPSAASDPVSRARSLSSTTDAAALYRDWAPRYDHEVFTEAGFTGSDRIADLLAENLGDRSALVLDLGCGTGAVGVRLHGHGFTTLDGFDLSPEMLAVARTKRVYRSLRTVDLTHPFASTTTDRYRGSVSAGTFTSGHVGPDAVAEIERVLDDLAIVAWVIALTVWPAFEPAIARAGLTVRSLTVEPIRRGGAPEAVMLVAGRDPVG